MDGNTKSVQKAQIINAWLIPPQQINLCEK